MTVPPSWAVSVSEDGGRGGLSAGGEGEEERGRAQRARRARCMCAQQGTRTDKLGHRRRLARVEPEGDDLVQDGAAAALIRRRPQRDSLCVVFFFFLRTSLGFSQARSMVTGRVGRFCGGERGGDRASDAEVAAASMRSTRLEHLGHGGRVERGGVCVRGGGGPSAPRALWFFDASKNRQCCPLRHTLHTRKKKKSDPQRTKAHAPRPGRHAGAWSDVLRSSSGGLQPPGLCIVVGLVARACNSFHSDPGRVRLGRHFGGRPARGRGRRHLQA